MSSMEAYINDQKIKNASSLDAQEYAYCHFIKGQFEGLDLNEKEFTECNFEDCDLSNAMIANTSFQEVKFTNCKLLGLAFDTCNPFNLELAFDRCILSMSSFYKTNMSKTPFISCQLEDVDFVECNLTEAKLSQCQLAGATFSRSKLIKADFRESINYSIDPNENQIKGALFSQPEVLSLLEVFNIKID